VPRGVPTGIDEETRVGELFPCDIGADSGRGFSHLLWPSRGFDGSKQLEAPLEETRK
jgi:hypothetical protein